MTAGVPAYMLDNAHPVSAEHHATMSELFDRYTRQRSAQLLDLAGAACLEVGYGGGEFAGWLADQVGPDGSVLATDIKPRDIAPHPRLTVRRHDVVVDPLPGTFDFIHARLVLLHLPQRRQVLTRLIGALNPGGVLLVEDLWPVEPAELVVEAPSPEARELFHRYRDVHRSMANSGGRGWARKVYGAMLEDGLVDVHADLHGEAWRGGGTGTRWIRTVNAQVREKLLEFGLTEDEFDRLDALLEDPRLVLMGYIICSTSGRRPE